MTTTDRPNPMPLADTVTGVAAWAKHFEALMCRETFTNGPILLDIFILANRFGRLAASLPSEQRQPLITRWFETDTKR